ncbi:unnamed protein product [Peronospora destructor]|uniref:MYND-type domain-containing protein n=1 Tax=Peronospora destructor TaxID=86335 RepID=A0AAV0TSY4_9STRA|nr:unnamed protein product [Peronospora destructor]
MVSVRSTNAANLNVGLDPSPVSTCNNDLDANSFIERTKEVKVDVNDYSRFKDIGADLDEDEASVKETPAVDESKCRNCSKKGARLKCSVCKKVVYCARKCQANDWQFHKRICKKSEALTKPEAPRRPSVKKSTSSPSSSGSSLLTKKTKMSSCNKPKGTSGSSVVVTDEPDLPDTMRGYKNGLPYFHRELSKEEQTLIGDIAPQKIEAKPVTATSVHHDGSAWNTAGTFEERVVTKWAEEKWTEIFTGATYVENNMRATLKTPEKIAGDASICVVRGKKRYLFDFNFNLPFEVSVSGGGTCKGLYVVNDISNDEDYQISCRLTDKLSSASEQNAVEAFVAKKKSGLQKELLRLIGVFANDFQQQ